MVRKHKPKVKWQPWTAYDAGVFIHLLEKVLLEHGWHCGITGSVLHKGKSKKDLDVIIYPHDSTAVNSMAGLHKVLREEMDMYLLVGHLAMRKHWLERDSTDQKHVEAWITGDEHRVDIMFLT